MSKGVRFVVDSTADLPDGYKSLGNVDIMPLTVILNDVSYQDGVNIGPDMLFDHVKQTGRLPKTAAPSPADYMEKISPLVDEGYEVVVINISSHLSASYTNASIAAAELKNVYAVDTLALSTGISLLAAKGLEMAEGGMGGEQIAHSLTEQRGKVRTSFVIDTLKYLHKGGRCSSVALLGANLLRLKPSIVMEEGQLTVGSKYRGRIADALMKYVEDRLENPGAIDDSRVFVTHTFDDEEIPLRVRKKIEGIMRFGEIVVNRAGATISSHCGPDTLGVLFMVR